MPVDTHEVVFSFDQPGDARNPLLVTLQQLRNRPVARDSRATALLGSQRVLIIDSQQERAQTIAHLLSSAGYWPFVAPTPLDAYTLFLQGSFHPFAIVLSDDDISSQFFLTRLSQQFIQRYDWKVPFIRLRIGSSDQIGPRSTEPLAKGQMLPGSTEPLDPAERGIRRPQPSQQIPGTPIPRSLEQPRRSSVSQKLTPWPGELPQRPAASQPPTQQSQQSPHFVLTRPPSAPLGSQKLPSQPLLDPHNARSGPISQPSSRPLASPRFPSQQGNQKQGEKVSLDGIMIGRSQLKSLIGSNPLGDVYLAYDRQREQNIAFKTIQINLIPFQLTEGLEVDYNFFEQEMNLLRQADHPHIARIIGIGKSYVGEVPFVYKAIPYYEKGSLAKWLSQHAGRAFPASDVKQVILQLADAIQFLHDRGLLYQNFKATNILIANEAANMRDLQVLLADLPIVRDMINLPKTPESYRYFAPEQWEGEAFTSSDQYGLAVVAYELLTGRAPFQVNSEVIMRGMHLAMSVPVPSSFNPRISPFIDKVLLRALSKIPEERFESVSAFAAALEQASR